MNEQGSPNSITSRVTWYSQLTPLQRLIAAVVWTAKQQKHHEAEEKRLYEEAIYGRP